jgi:hypothetical protein
VNDFMNHGGPGDEDELRRRLTEAVSGIRPGDGSLERLQKRVTARRRQRQVMVTGGAVAVAAVMVASAVLIGPGKIDRVRDSITPGGGGSQSGGKDKGGESSNQAADSRNWPSGHPGGSTGPVPAGTPTKAPGGQKPTPTVGATPTLSATPTKSPDTTVRACTVGDLAKTDSQSLVNKADGSVGYGFLEFANTSASACSVAGPPVVKVVDATSGADVGFTVGARSATDSPALASVATWGRVVVLKPNDTYRFQFAWTNKAASGSDVACAGPDSSDTSKTWALRYQAGATDSAAVAQVSLPAACKGSLYETDIYLPGEYTETFGT